jgi:nucleotide-binding universal stress UspA family protein
MVLGRRSQAVYRKIVVALQEKGTDEAIVAHVRGLAALHGARVTLLRVIANGNDGGDGLGHLLQMESGTSGWQRKERARAYVAQLERRLRLQGCRVETAVVVGTRCEADAIVHFADESGCDLVAMPSDTRPWLLRALKGDTASKVQRKATVPTLFVHNGLRKATCASTVANPHPMMAVVGGAGL